MASLAELKVIPDESLEIIHKRIFWEGLLVLSLMGSYESPCGVMVRTLDSGLGDPSQISSVGFGHSPSV